MSRVLDVTDVHWPFDGEPYVKLHYQEGVDPFPCYAHDTKLVAKILKVCDKVGKVKHKPIVRVLHHEVKGRTNGWATVYPDYSKRNKPGGPHWDGAITLLGKRIPLHPAMTRYLVAHEYGHHVQYELNRRKGKEAHHKEILDEYCKVRKVKTCDQPYGALTWHRHIGEIFANDFRILIAEQESEFWPHDCAHPTKVKGLIDWWRENL